MERLFRQPTTETNAEILHKQKIYYRVKKQIAWKQKINPAEKKIYEEIKQSDNFSEILLLPDVKLTNYKINPNEPPQPLGLITKQIQQLEYFVKRQKEQIKIVNSNLYTLKNRIKNEEYTSFK